MAERDWARIGEIVARDIVVRQQAAQRTVWVCTKCNAANGSNRKACIACGTKREATR